MKRLVLILVVLVALVGAAFYIFSRGSETGAAGFLPADTVLYVALPDIKRSGERWPKTALAQIGNEPAVADFLRKPIERITAGGWGEAKGILDKLDPKQMFFAVATVHQTGANVVLGFQYSGSRKDLDEAMARLYGEVAKMAPKSSQSTAEYKGDTVTTTTIDKPVFFTASQGTWAFISNNEPLLQQTLDRAAGREKSPALSASDEFQKVLSHLSLQPDFLWYTKPKPIIDLIVELTKNQPGEINPKAFQQLEKMKAFGGTLAFDGLNQKEVSFILYPDAPKLSPINRSPMAFTKPETSLFFDSAMDTQTIATDDYFQSLPPEAQTFLTNAKIDLKKMPEILGNDVGFVLDWPVSAIIPNAIFAVEIKDRAAAQSLVQSALSGFGLPIPASEVNGATVFQFPSMQLIDPAVAVTDKFMLASLTSTEMNRALNLAPGTPTLETAESFKPALSAYKKNGLAFGYVDSKALFERIYNMARPMAVLAGAMSPGVSQVIDVQKVPETETISRHLTPILYSADQTADGLLVESSGPVTLTQGFAIIVAGAAAVFAGQMAASGM